MGVGDALKGDLKGMLGNIAKAVLVFPDAPEDKVEKEEVEKQGAAGGKAGVKAPAKPSIPKNALKKNAIGNDELEKALEEIKSKNKGAKILRVQFNPATISISAYGGGRAPITNYTTSKGQADAIQYGAVDPNVTVAFKLVFDQTNIADAFFIDKFTLGPTALGKNIATAVATKKGKEFSVRPIVEGFLAAVRNEHYRSVIFLWGSLRYQGIVNQIACTYTMFSPSGNPIRAEVTMRLMCSAKELNNKESGADTKTNEAAVQFWQKRYKEIIEKNMKTDSNGSYIDAGKVSNQLNGLVNI